jgi:DNA-binding CsgD family transcriptional regulator
MELTLSASEQRQLEAAARVLLSPLDVHELDAWRAEVLARLAELVQADCAGFILPQPGATPYTLHNLPESFGVEYFATKAGTEESMKAILSMGGGVWNTRMLGELLGMAMPEAWLASDDYRSFYGRYGIQDALGFAAVSAHVGAAGLLSRPDGATVSAAVTCFRGVYGTEAFGDHGLAILRLLLPALEAGVATRVRLAGQARALEHAFESAPYGIAVYALEGRRLYANRTFSRLLEEHAGHDRLRGTIEAGVQSLSRLARSNGAAGPRQFDGAHQELRTSRGRYRVRLNLIGEGLFASQMAVLAALERMGPELPSIRALRERWQLTAQEARVALLLARGQANKEIAAAMELSPATIRHYTEAIFRKLRVHTRAEVAGKILTT